MKEDSMAEERLLRLRDVSARLSISRTAIYRLMESGELPRVKLGRALRFSSSSVDRLIEDLKGATHAA